jgi:hypothetical protein
MNENKPDGSDTKREQEALFMGFVSLVGNMAMQQMGKTPNPATGKTEKHLDVARAWIETLKMIEVKTTGNLSADEESFLTGTIADLQMNYVDEVKQGGEPAPPRDDAGQNEAAGESEKDGQEGKA